MKRPLPDDCSNDGHGPSILAMLLAHNDKNLRLHVFQYCYRSVNALKRTCKALRELLDLERPAFWRYGCLNELRQRLVWWPTSVVEAFCERFDPFFDEWPQGMPGRPPAPKAQNVLRWIWHKFGPWAPIYGVGGNYYAMSITTRVCVLHETQETIRMELAFWWKPADQKWKIRSSWAVNSSIKSGAEWPVLPHSLDIEHVIGMKNPQRPHTYVFQRIDIDYGKVHFWMRIYSSKSGSYKQGYCAGRDNELLLDY